MKKYIAIAIVVILGLALSIVGYTMYTEKAHERAFTDDLEQFKVINSKYSELSEQFTKSYQQEMKYRSSLQPAIEENKATLKKIVKTIEEQQEINKLQQAEITKSESFLPNLKTKLQDLSSEPKASASQMVDKLELQIQQKKLIYQQNNLILDQEHTYFLQLSQGKLDAKVVNSQEYTKLNQLIDQLNKQQEEYQQAYRTFFDQTK